jgi:uncharacterized membrane protein YoaK (UPF0700 family)
MGKTNIKILTPVNIVGFILIMMAGWIDAVGVHIFLNENSSFLTGRAVKLGKCIINGDTQKIKSILLIIISFIVGACISTLITKRVGLIGGLLFTGIFIIITAFTTSIKGINVAFVTIPMCMGGQNAATSITDINRTTHLTGPATDIGINIAEGNWNLVVFWVLRWVGFLMGVMIAYKLIQLFKIKTINFSYMLFIPGIVIILTGIIQKKIVDIPLLEGAGKQQINEQENY